MPPPTFTIDTLVSLLTKHVLTPFPLILLALAHAAVSTDPLRLYAPATLSVPLPSTLTLYLSTALLLYLTRFLLSLDTSLANGPRRHVDWEDEVVLITGGLGGLGGVIAEVYGMRGVLVAVLDVRALHAAETEGLEEKGIRYWQCDVGDREQVEKVTREVQEELGHPTILINNAAIVTGKPFLQLTDEDIDRTFRVNTLSALHLSRLLLPHMLSRPNGGHIVTISSVLGYTGCAALSAYTSTKAALIAFHQSLTAELAILASSSSYNGASSEATLSYPSAVKTTLVTPGALETPLFASIPPPATALHAFVGPKVGPKDLAMEIVRRIDRGEGGEVSMPLYAGWIGVLRLLPPGLAGFCRRMAGLDESGWGGYGAPVEKVMEGQGKERVR